MLKLQAVLKNYLPGLILCFLLALPAYYLGLLLPLVGGPVFAILIGMVLAPLVNRYSVFKAGMSFTSKKVLQLAVILLGFSMNLNQVLSVGATSLPIILSTISVSLILSVLLTRWLKLDRDTGILVGVGSSICGGSAIAATAPIIKADDEDIAKSISVIFLFNILAALIFPSLGDALGFSNEGFGLFAGTAVNDTSSVTAAASSWDAVHGSNTLDIATVVKLTRTLAIIPISIALSLIEARRRKKAAAGSADRSTGAALAEGGSGPAGAPPVEEGKTGLKLTSLLPLFIVLFVVASVITTYIPLPADLISKLKFLSKFFITMAMGAIGLNTNLIKLIKTGGKAILLGFICWLGITLVSIGVQHLCGLV